MSYSPKYAAARSFAARLARNEPQARIALRGLVQAHARGDASATRAIQTVATVARKEGIAVGEHSSIGEHSAIGSVVAPVGRFTGRTFSTAASLLEGTGRLIGKPFRWASRKLGATAPFRLPTHKVKMLAPHKQVPQRR